MVGLSTACGSTMLQQGVVTYFVMMYLYSCQIAIREVYKGMLVFWRFVTSHITSLTSAQIVSPHHFRHF